MSPTDAAVSESIKKYAAYLNDKRRTKARDIPMSPWDEALYFDLPVETIVTVSAGAQSSLCLANPRRIALYLSTLSANSVVVSFNPANLVSGLTCIPLQSTTLPFVLLQEQTGPLCQQQWFAGLQAGIVGPVSVTVIEVVMKEWPR